MLLLATLALLLAQAPPAPPSPPQAGRRAPPPPAAPAPQAQAGKRAGDWPAKRSGKTVTLTKKMSVDEALEKIASAAGWNLVANTGRLGDRIVILGLREVPVE